MPEVTIQVPEEVEAEPARYGDQVADLPKVGLRQVKMDESLALFRRGGCPFGARPGWQGSRYAR